jgi:hypothetical protein
MRIHISAYMSIFLHKMRILYTSCAHIILIDWVVRAITRMTNQNYQTMLV